MDFGCPPIISLNRLICGGNVLTVQDVDRIRIRKASAFGIEEINIGY